MWTSQTHNNKCANETFQHKRHVVVKRRTVWGSCSCTQACLNTNKQSQLFYYCTWIIEQHDRRVYSYDCCGMRETQTDRGAQRLISSRHSDSSISIPKDVPWFPAEPPINLGWHVLRENTHTPNKRADAADKHPELLFLWDLTPISRPMCWSIQC